MYEMEITLPASRHCGEHQIRRFKGPGDIKKLCKGKVLRV